ncbi:hypothetical protein [Luteimonas sp. SDU101]|uniref:hypothetical protein n=1 Tax=unclassified Luteimonas TaxID=2629088 RepID=UPI003EB69E69
MAYDMGRVDELRVESGHACSDINEGPEASVKLTSLLMLIGVGVVALVGFDQNKSRMAGRAEVSAVQPTPARAPAGDPPWGPSRTAPQIVAPAVAASRPHSAAMAAPIARR